MGNDEMAAKVKRKKLERVVQLARMDDGKLT